MKLLTWIKSLFLDHESELTLQINKNLEEICAMQDDLIASYNNRLELQGKIITLLEEMRQTDKILISNQDDMIRMYRNNRYENESL